MPTNLYGPGDNYHPTNSHVMAALIRRFHQAVESNAPSVTCWGTGTPLREFLHVDDLGEACVFALENWCPSSDELQYLNVGTGVDLSIHDLAHLAAKVVGYEGDIQWDSSKPDGTPRKLLDVSKLEAMGWRAAIPLAEGLGKTYAAFQETLLTTPLVSKE
jgi:GDP-L-fucose synthase